MKADQVKKTADLLFEQGQYSKAYKLYMFLIREEPHNVDFRLRLGETCIHLGCKNDALKIYKNLTAYLTQKGEFLRAISVVQRILEINPQDQEMQKHLEDLFAQNENENTQWKKSQEKARQQVEQIAQGKVEISTEVLDLAGPGDKVTSTITEMISTTRSPNEAQFGFSEEGSSGLDLADDSEREESISGLDGMIEMGFGTTERIVDLSIPTTAKLKKPLPKIPLFSDLPPGAFSKVVERFKRQNYRVNSVIVKQGDIGNSLYILASGKVQVIRQNNGSQKVYAQLKPGEFFGEFPYFSRSPRQASVVCLSPVEVLELTRQDIQQIIQENSQVEKAMRKFYKERVLHNLLIESPLFSKLSEANRRYFLEKFAFQTIEPGRVILKEGDPPDAFYVIQSGRVRVSKEANPDKTLAELQAGDFFGEFGMITGAPRTATITAIDKTELVLFTRAIFREFLKGQPHVIKDLKRIAKERIASQKHFQ